MARMTNTKKAVLAPVLQKILSTVGEQIRLARLRRRMSAEIVSEKAGISRATLWKIEKGDATVAFGLYAKVLNSLNLERSLLEIAKDDELGRLLQDAELSKKYR